MTTGSLGQGTSLAVGMAMGDMLKGLNSRTFLIVGDGEANEGQDVYKRQFERWLKEAPTAHSMIERVHEHFELGGHKAAAIAMVLENARIDLISELPDEFVRSIFLNPQPDLSLIHISMCIRDRMRTMVR